VQELRPCVCVDGCFFALAVPKNHLFPRRVPFLKLKGHEGIKKAGV
jgi:hypothetical protein